MESTVARLEFDAGGGGLVGFHLKDASLKGAGITPMAWNNPGPDDLEPREMAHFIALDRWGGPTASEMENGMPFHGEASHSQWKIEGTSASSSGAAEAQVSLNLPLASLALVRRMKLSGTVLHVDERISNKDKLGRAWNLVEHVTIGPPFLNENTLVDSSVEKGFTQDVALRLPLPEEPTVGWPLYEYEGRQIDMRRLSDFAGPLITSYVFPDGQSYGWATAFTPDYELLVGYVWKTAHFPWLNFWRHVEGGRPKARGLEFGTTGLFQPYPILASKMKIFDRPLLAWIDAKETISREYLVFLSPAPADFRGVLSLEVGAKELTLIEHGDHGRQLRIPTTGASFLEQEK